MLIFIYILICLIVGLMGVNKKFGFWGYFFGSVVLTPVLGFILVLVSDPKKRYSSSSAELKEDRKEQKPDTAAESDKNATANESQKKTDVQSGG